METNDFKASDLRKLRLRPLSLAELPAHPTIPAQNGITPDIEPFITEVLREAVAFSDSIIPTIFSRKGGPKASPPSTAKVQMLSSELIKDEAWFARQSHHEDAAAAGTASYKEFEDGLFHDHSVHEADYTPNVYDAYKVLDYSGIIAGKTMGGFTDVAMELYEMCHKMPPPLDNRVFSTLVVRGKTGPTSFVDAQIPVDIVSLPASLYCSGRNRTEGASAIKKSRVVIGQYVSVERVRFLDSGSDSGKILWEMGTASDAKGMLPMSVQKLGVPGAIVKDVGWFIEFAASRRGASAAAA